MGNSKEVARSEKLRATLLIAASLAMLMVTISPLAAQEVPADNVPEDLDPPTVQPVSVQEPPGEPTTVIPVEPVTAPPEIPPTAEVPGQLPAEVPEEPLGEVPVEPSVEPPVGVPGNCDHVAGEFLVGYVSEEALRAAPRENVAETFGGILAQHLVFADIKNISDPAARLAAEEAKRQELAARPGVSYAEYNCVSQAASAEMAPRSIPSIASCGDCGRTVVEGARRIIDDGFEGTGSKGGFNAALEAAKSSDAEDNVAFASEAGEDASEDRDSADDADGEDEDSTATSSSDESEPGEGSEDGAAEDGANESEADEKADSGSDDEANDGEDATGEGGFSGEAASGEDTPGEEEDTGVDSLSATPVTGKNVASSSSAEPREISGPGVLALGAGAFLLVAGVFVGRRILQG